MLCFYGGDYEECRLLGYENLIRTSQETHYVSATKPSQLMLCKIWCFYGGDYEECRLLGYETLIRISQETHYASATESSWLMLFKIWGFHGGDYEEFRLLGTTFFITVYFTHLGYDAMYYIHQVFNVLWMR
jgi:hypothetical protein